MGSFFAAIGLILASGVAAHADCSPAEIEVRGMGGVARFSVEVADDDAERALGLMNRDRMASSAGMLFVFQAPRTATFWMKDTLIPLDMIFADAAGVVTAVHANAVPLDKSPINGGPGVSFVLEINGGLAGRMGIAPGSVLRHPAVTQESAAWRCVE